MKNEAEVKGMRRAHLRDAVAMCTLFSYIEVKNSSLGFFMTSSWLHQNKMITCMIIFLLQNKSGLDELSVTKIVDDTRETQAGYIGTSMNTRVAFSTNGAEPDYRPTHVSNRRIFNNATLVVHSGGQYGGKICAALYKSAHSDLSRLDFEFYKYCHCDRSPQYCRLTL